MLTVASEWFNMCWSKKCCYVVELDLGCLMIGILTLMVSVGVWIASIVLFCAEENDKLWYMHNATEHFLGVFHLDVNQRSKELVLSIIVFVAVVSTMTSIALIVGVRKRLPGLVLVYFAFGIFLTFFLSLSSLLLLLKTSWWIALILMAASLINIHFLVVVHTFYELLLMGKVFDAEASHRSDFDDDEVLVETEIEA